MMRQPGMNPALGQVEQPGNSLRRDKSPVAPTRMTTCGYLGPTPGRILFKFSSPQKRPEPFRYQVQPGFILRRWRRHAMYFFRACSRDWAGGASATGCVAGHYADPVAANGPSDCSDA